MLSQTFAIIALGLVVVVGLLILLKLLARIGTAVVKIGCVLVILFLLLVSAYLTWLVLSGRI